MKNRKSILGCQIDAITMEQTLEKIDNAIKNNTSLHHVVVNAAKLVNMRKNNDLRASVEGCDIINADGMAIVWASRILGSPLPERVAGIDLFENLVELAYLKNYKVYFLGARQEVVEKVVEKFRKKYTNKIIAGFRNGYFSVKEEESIAKDIAQSGADMLFVAISSPMKEIFLNKYKEFIQVPFIMGVGGSFDVVSGLTKRAPLWIQQIGLEWFYRFLQEPKRMWKRYLITNTIFLALLTQAFLKKLIKRKTKD